MFEMWLYLSCVFYRVNTTHPGFATYIHESIKLSYGFLAHVQVIKHMCSFDSVHVVKGILKEEWDKVLKQEHSETVDLLVQAAHYLHIARILDLKNQHGDQDHPKYLINCSLHHCRAILKFSLQSVHNLLSNSRILDWAVNIVIQITTKIYSLVPFTTPDPFIKFHCNPFRNV